MRRETPPPRSSERLRAAPDETQRLAERPGADASWRVLPDLHRRVLDSVGEGVYVLDLNGILRFMNPAFARLLGWEEGEMLGKPAHSMIHHTRADGSRYPPGECPIHATLRDGNFHRVEDEVFWCKSGTSVPVAYTSTPLQGETGDIAGVVVAFRDLTEQKRADERLRLVVESSPNALVMMNSEGRMTLVNAQTESLFGYARSELLGHPIERLVPERYRAAHPAHRGGFFASPSTRPMGGGRDLFGLRKDGREVPIEIGLNPLVTAEGAFVLASIIDITERKRAEASLREAHDRLETRVRERTSQLAATNESLREEVGQRERAEEELRTLSRKVLMAQEDERRRIARELHDEVGQLLTGVKLNLENVTRQPTLEAVLERVPLAIQSINQAIRQVRSLSFDLRPSLLDDLGLPEALRWYVDRQARDAGIQGQVVAGDGTARLPPEIEVACYRVAQEAVTNVLRHARAQSVRVELRQIGLELEMRVSDDGQGFDPTEARARTARGECMGVSGMRERVSLVGGRLDITSAPFAGTQVVARFPVPAAPDVS